MIPRIIHQTAPKNKKLWHPIWEKCHNSWKKEFSVFSFKHIMWDDESIDNFIKNKFPQYINIYKKIPFHIMKLDFFRYCVLYEYGGIYADMDIYCYKNFFGDLDKKCYLIESFFEDEKVQNCLMVSEKYNLFMKTCIDKSIQKFSEIAINDNFFDSKDPESLKNVSLIKETFGPLFLTKMLYEYSSLNVECPELLDKEIYNNHHLTYSEEYVTKHMLSGRWGKDQIENLIKMNHLNFPQYNHDTFLKIGYKNFRHVDVDNFDFKKNYVKLL